MSDSRNEAATTSLLRSSLKRGLTAALQNRVPGFCLWVFGVVLIICYFNVPLVHDWLERIGAMKLEYGWMFGAISTALFGGALPLLILLMTGKSNPSTPNVTLGLFISNVLFWGLKGIEVDLFYVIQNYFFGSEFAIEPIFFKTVVDQFVYCPIFGVLTVVLFYLWRDNGYSWTRFKSALGRNWYLNHVFPVLLSGWFVWIPAVAIIYCLPLPLQLPVQNLILCFWVLVLTFFTSAERKTEVDAVNLDHS